MPIADGIILQEMMWEFLLYYREILVLAHQFKNVIVYAVLSAKLKRNSDAGQEKYFFKHKNPPFCRNYGHFKYSRLSEKIQYILRKRVKK